MSRMTFSMVGWPHSLQREDPAGASAPQLGQRQYVFSIAFGTTGPPSHPASAHDEGVSRDRLSGRLSRGPKGRSLCEINTAIAVPLMIILESAG